MRRFDRRWHPGRDDPHEALLEQLTFMAIADCFKT
jgi:hypothetical protein